MHDVAWLLSLVKYKNNFINISMLNCITATTNNNYYDLVLLNVITKKQKIIIK